MSLKLIRLTVAALAAAVAASCGPGDAVGQANAQNASASARVAEYRGVYMTGRIERGLQPEALNQPGVDGVYLSMKWNRIEPRPGQFDWSELDRSLQQTRRAGKVVSLAVRSGEAAPEWLYDNGVGRFRSVMGPKGGNKGKCWVVTVPRYWDPAYLSAYDRMMRALSAHLKKTGAYDSVRIVKITGINLHTGETRMPTAHGDDKRTEEQRRLDIRPDLTPDPGERFRKRQPCLLSDATGQWQREGYRPSKAIAAWRSLATSVNRAFPDKVLSIAILANGGFPLIDEAGERIRKSDPDREVVKTEIIASGVRMFPGRFAVQWNGLNDSTLKPALVQARNQGAMLGLQTNLRGGGDEGARCRSDMQGPWRPCTATTYQAMLDRGIDSGGRYLEVWQADVLKFPEVIEHASDRLKAGPRRSAAAR